MVSATDGDGTTTASSVDSFFINPPREGPPQGGTIEGLVTDAVSGQPVGGVKACAVGTDGAEPHFCVHTNASGHYEMTVAEAGDFVVEFTEAPHSIYIGGMYYGGKYSKSEASKTHIQHQTGQRLWVQAVVVFWSEFPEQLVETDRCVYIHGSHLRDWLSGQPTMLDASQIHTITASVLDLAGAQARGTPQPAGGV